MAATPSARLVDLHRHLDGSLRPATLEALAAEQGLRVDTGLRFRPGMGLELALACFRTTLAVLQRPEAVQRVAAEMCEDAAAEGLSGLEIRFAPQLHRGASPEAIVDAALEGAQGRATFVLCGLYGEDPALLARNVAIARSRAGVVGIDLAGGPEPAHAHHLSDYAWVFSAARDAGLGRTVHAGEGRPAQEIRVAVEVLHAQRVGHATTVLDDPALVDLLIERGVTLEACPTSNVHTGIFLTVAHHPLRRWLDRGLAVAVCTDNTFFSEVTLPQELARVRQIDGITDAHLAQVARYAQAGRFS